MPQTQPQPHSLVACLFWAFFDQKEIKVQLQVIRLGSERDRDAGLIIVQVIIEIRQQQFVLMETYEEEDVSFFLCSR